MPGAKPTPAATSSATSTSGTRASGPRWTPRWGRAPARRPRSPQLELQFVGNVRDPLLRQNGLALGTVVANRELVDLAKPGARSKRHVEIALPEGMTYRTGDYLAVLPLNPGDLVQRALARFNLDYDSHVQLGMERGDTFLPTGTPVAVGELLSSYVELAVPATRSQLEDLADVAADPAHRAGA